MKKYLATALTLASMAALSFGAVTNTVMWGGSGDVTNFTGNGINWDDANIVTNTAMSPTNYSISCGVDRFGVARYQDTAISNLVVTVTFGETTGVGTFINGGWLGGLAGDERRLDGSEVIEVTVSYSDPDNVLQSLRLKEVGPWFNQATGEITDFSDGTNTVSVPEVDNGFTINYAATALNQLNVNNTGSWKLLVSVQGVTTSGLGPFILEWITDTDYVAPEAPTNLTAVGYDSVVLLDWDANSAIDVESYNVYRSTNSGSYGAALTNVTGNSYVDYALTNGVTYYYVVTAVDNRPAANESEDSVEVSATPADAVLPTDPILFGSTNDGLGGFIQSSIGGDETWSTQTNSVRYTNDDTGYQNFSFLNQFPMDRSAGNSYTITGTLTWNTYADDNNRIGIYLFGGQPDLGVDPGEDETGALCLLYNIDNNRLRIYNGIDESRCAQIGKNGTAPSGEVIDYALTFTANVDFVDELGTTWMEIEFILKDNEGIETTLTLKKGDDSDFSGLPGDYAGNWFGFAGRGRNDGDAVNEDGDTVYVANLQSFFIESLDPLAPFIAWADGFGGTNSIGGPADDFDSDGLDNLGEYGLDGDPTTATNVGYVSRITADGAYIHAQRNDDNSLGYTIQMKTDLRFSWSNATPLVVDTLVDGRTAGVDIITNDVGTVEDEKFIRLIIEQL